MLCVWTSQPSKVPAYCMSAPVVVNQYPLWVVFQQQAARAHRFGAKERKGRDSDCGGAWSIGWLCPNSHADGEIIGYVRAVLIRGACTRWNDRCGSCGDGVVLPPSSAVHIAACHLLVTWRVRAAVRPTLSPSSTVITGAKWHCSG